METARLIRWLKKPGDTVRMGEPLAEMETDKATMDVESPADGVLTEILVAEGQDVAVGGSLWAVAHRRWRAGADDGHVFGADRGDRRRT